MLLCDKGVFLSQKESPKLYQDVLGRSSVCLNVGEFTAPICLATKEIDVVSVGFADVVRSFELLYNGNTIQEWFASNLSACRDLEYFAGQVVFGKTFNKIDISTYDHLFAGEIDKVRDGRIDSKEYEKFCKSHEKSDYGMTCAVLTALEVRRLNELIRCELAHSSSRIRQALAYIIEVIKEVNKSSKVKIGEEYVKFSPSADEVGFALVDAIKAISTALDATSKVFGYLSSLQLQKLSKVPAVISSNLNGVSAAYFEGDEKREFLSNLSEIKQLILLRNELTHNQAFYPLRQPIFVGCGTPCVDGHPLLYGDMLFWDSEDSGFSRSYGSGFFSQHRNAIKQVYQYIIKSIDFIEFSYKLQKKMLSKRLQQMGMDKVVSIQELPNSSIEYIDVNLKELI